MSDIVAISWLMALPLLAFPSLKTSHFLNADDYRLPMWYLAGTYEVSGARLGHRAFQAGG